MLLMHSIRRIYARVALEPAAARESFLEQIREHKYYDEMGATLRSPDKLRLEVTLSAEDKTGRLIEATGSFRIGSLHKDLREIRPRYHDSILPADHEEKIAYIERASRVESRNIEDKINARLGRKPGSHRPRRPSWGCLIRALEQVDITVSEEELIALPLTMELDDELRAEMESWRPGR
jgi:hypothetical protein